MSCFQVVTVCWDHIILYVNYTCSVLRLSILKFICHFYCLVTQFIMVFLHFICQLYPNKLCVISKLILLLTHFFQIVYGYVEQRRFCNRSHLICLNAGLRTHHLLLPSLSVFSASQNSCQEFCLISWHLSFLKKYLERNFVESLENPSEFLASAVHPHFQIVPTSSRLESSLYKRKIHWFYHHR